MQCFLVYLSSCFCWRTLFAWNEIYHQFVCGPQMLWIIKLHIGHVLHVHHVQQDHLGDKLILRVVPYAKAFPYAKAC